MKRLRGFFAPSGTAERSAKEETTGDSPESPSAKDRPQPTARPEILSGPISKGILKIAIPSVATMLLQTVNTMLDRFFIGHLEAGPEAQAAITISNTLMFALMSAAFAVSIGTTALVARSVGEGDIKSAEKATQQSLILGFLVSLLIGIPMYLLRLPLLTVLGLQPAARGLADLYLGTTLIGLPVLFLALVLNGAFRGIGDTVRPFWVTLGGNLVHAIGNYLLIFGNFGFPKMGLPGGALALTLSYLMQAILYAVFLRHSPLKHLPLSLVPVKEWVIRIAKIGLPAAGQQLIRVGSMLGFQSLLAHSGAGDAAVAALGIGLVSESIAFMPGFGYSIAASAFVGQNLGAKQVERANAGAWAATWQAVGVMTVMGAVFFVAAEPFARLLVPHLAGETAARAAQVEMTVGLVVSYLRIAAVSEPFLGLGMVLTGALQGAGETVSPTVITIVTMVGTRLVFGYLFLNVLNFGTNGAWWAMAVSTIIQGIWTVFLFRRGKWRHTKV